MEMICENAGKCSNTKCQEKYPHENYGVCDMPCTSVLKGAILGSKCIPYIEPAKKIITHVKEIWKGVGTNDKPAIAPLTDHPKYCRLSKQAGGLCGCKMEEWDRCEQIIKSYTHAFAIQPQFEACMFPLKQQPVDLPKDPLEELIQQEYAKVFCACMEDSHVVNKQKLRDFAEKVRALNG